MSWPISRVLSRATIHLGGLSPIRSSDLPRSRMGHALVDLYLVLLQVGFTLPRLLPDARCALTAPFHPYLLLGGLFSVALSVGSHPPGVTWHSAQWSPDFPPHLCITTETQRLLSQLGADCIIVSKNSSEISKQYPGIHFLSHSAG